jgi:predicted lipoprotein with Yx(FWY)xxD motif
VRTVGAPAAGEGATAGLLGTITRQDGSTQVTYGGKPLYYFANDEKPGDTKGQNVGGNWFVLSAAGEAIRTTS